MTKDKWNKSRAQEVSQRVKGLYDQIAQLQETRKKLQAELKENCPHPDDHVRKLDEFRSTNVNRTRPDGRLLLRELWYCELCSKTMTLKGVG